VHSLPLTLARAALNREVRGVSLSLRAKQSLYHSLGQLLRSGVPLPGALVSLAQTARGSQRELIQQLNKDINGGLTISAAMARHRPVVSELEVGIVSAVEKSGRLEYGMAELAKYFEALAKAREHILKESLYPALVLHFGVVTLSLPTLIFGGGTTAYIHQTVGTFAVFYGIVLVIALARPLCRDAGSRNASLDYLLRRIPLLGKVRRAFAVSRFCATYEMQFDAGVNVFDAMLVAQRAAMSGLIRAAVERAMPAVRNGAQVGPELAASGAFPEAVMRAFSVGEQTGQLSSELKRLAADYQEEAIAGLDTAAKRIAKIFYVAVLIYVGYGIVMGYKQYLDAALKMGEGI